MIVAALHDLREEELYLHYTRRRYRFEPMPNLAKLVRDETNRFTQAEVLEMIRGQPEEHLKELAARLYSRTTRPKSTMQAAVVGRVPPPRLGWPRSLYSVRWAAYR